MMNDARSQRYVSRGGEKLAAALSQFQIDPAGLICADLGSHVGGFVDCLLQHGALRVISVDTSYGTLAWRLRRDPRVTVLERTNAMHVRLDEPVDLVTIDAGWTRQRNILPNVKAMLKPKGRVITLIKPHYERSSESEATKKPSGPKGSRKKASKDVLPDDQCEEVVDAVLGEIRSMGWTVDQELISPIRGHGGNREMLALLSLVTNESA